MEGIKYGALISATIAGPTIALDRDNVLVIPIVVDRRFAAIVAVLTIGVLILRVFVSDRPFATVNKEVFTGALPKMVATVVLIRGVLIAVVCATNELISFAITELDTTRVEIDIISSSIPDEPPNLKSFAVILSE